ncbi:MAG TPA: hypothetical protein DCW90_00490 [Lachnospiraceae bacterium]|nr:hypothetical protein [Lachnospiraceae bacterium]
MMKFRKKPVVIEAVQWTGENLADIEGFVRDNLEAYFLDELKYPILYIKTLEGSMKASVGDYIIKGVNGEFYPCKPDIFEKTYEKV